MVESGLHISPVNPSSTAEDLGKGQKRVLTAKRNILKSRKKLKTGRGGMKRYDYSGIVNYFSKLYIFTHHSFKISS